MIEDDDSDAFEKEATQITIAKLIYAGILSAVSVMTVATAIMLLLT